MMIAYVREKDTNQHTAIRSEYATKSDFAEDLRRNGYAVICIHDRRDIAAIEKGYRNFSEMQKRSVMWRKDPEFYAEKLADLKEVTAIK